SVACGRCQSAGAALVSCGCGVGRAGTHRYRGIDIPRTPCNGGGVRKTTSGVLNTASPSRHCVLPESQCHWTSALRLMRVFLLLTSYFSLPSPLYFLPSTLSRSVASAQWHWLSGVSHALEDSLSVETSRPDHAGRAVDVNRPVRHWCAPAVPLPARLRTVTGGLTSPARPVTWGGVRKTTSGVLNTVSPSQV
ncbi:MAG: hypothetical protein RLZZ436_219, partial [Planctomycetota bacterium]